jgi:hypothetical protein
MRWCWWDNMASCKSARQAGMPAMDIQMISRSLTGAKELIAGVMAESAQNQRPVRKGLCSFSRPMVVLGP